MKDELHLRVSGGHSPASLAATSEPATSPVPELRIGGLLSRNRKPLLDQLIDDHLAGHRVMPQVEKILRAVDEARAPLAQEELLAAAGVPKAGPIVQRLVDRGVLEQRCLQPRVLLGRPRDAFPSSGSPSLDRQQRRR
jgi:hypothetical protein